MPGSPIERQDDGYPSSADPESIGRATQIEADVPGDAADQAERLAMVMEAEAIRSALHGTAHGEGSLEGWELPLEDLEETVSMEDADDASDDPLHGGGFETAPWVSPEHAAMHILEP